MPEVIDPVVVHGHGRTGTTLLVRLLGVHPDLAWFSQYEGRWPARPELAALNRIADVAWLRRRLGERRAFPQPAEAIQAWERRFPGFYDNRPDLGATVDDGATAAFGRDVAAVRRWQGKRGFLTKYTGHPRYDLVRRALPGVRIVHLDRDPRAVVMSVVKQRWGFKHDDAGWARLSPIERIDLASDRYLAWAGEMARQSPQPGGRSLRYEDLIGRPADTVRDLFADLGLRPVPGLAADLAPFGVRGVDDGWRHRASPDELAHLEARLEPALDARGYR